MDEAKLAELTAANGGRACLLPLGNPDIEIVVRAPTRPEYKVCRAAIHDPARMPDAMEDLIRKLVVYVNGKQGAWPDVVAEFDRLLEIYPALCENKAVVRAVQEFTGLEFTASGKGSTTSASGSAPAPRTSQTG